MSPQHKRKFDNNFHVTRSFNISKYKITNKNDKGKERSRGTTVMLLVLLRGTQFDLMEKNGNPWIFFVTFSKMFFFLEKFRCNR